MIITHRLLVLFLIISISLTVFILVFLQIKKEERKLYNLGDALQRRQIINSFLNIKKKGIMSILEDNKLYEDLVSYLQNPNTKIYNHSFKALLSTYNLDLVQIYNQSGIRMQNYVSEYEHGLENFSLPTDFFTGETVQKRKYFTEPWRNEFMQVGAASLHSKADTLKTSEPLGYVIITKMWDPSYLEDFSKNLDFQVRLFLAQPAEPKKLSPHDVNIILPLTNWSNQPVAWLRFHSSNPFLAQQKTLSTQILLGVLIFTLLFLFVQFLLLYHWINHPLKLISLSLKNGNPELIHFQSLKRNEFGEISRLVKRFFEQNQQLRYEMEERRKTEIMLRQAQKMESIGTLAGGIAHDFNNIITIISGYIALTSNKIRNNRESMNNLAQALKACQRAKSLIEKILTFSRQTEKDVQPLNLAMIVQETIDLLSVSIPSSIEIITEFNSKANVLADPVEMQQVVMNIASNAYHAMLYQGGKMRIKLSDISGEEICEYIQNADSHLEYVCLSIEDTGAGMPPEILERIFDPYFSTKAPKEGTGLGLSIVHGIVTGCGGHIHVTSVLEQGTIVKTFIPTTILKPVEKQIAEEDAPFFPAKVFFVDDEPALMELFNETISNAGYDVTAFTDSQLALREFEDNPDNIDILVADIAMPGLNGLQLARKVLDHKPRLPIILYTGYSDDNIRQTCFELGIKQLLNKPVLPESLNALIRKILSEQTST